MKQPAEDNMHVSSRPSAFRVAKAWQPDPRWREVLCQDFAGGHCATQIKEIKEDLYLEGCC